MDYRLLLMIAGLYLSTVVPAFSQQVDSFELLQLLVRPGDKVFVTEASGQSTSGRIQSLSATSLRLASKSGIREFAQKDALEIKQRRPDSLNNGVGIGAIVGLGIGTGLALACVSDNSDCEAGFVFAFLGTFTAMGTGVGAGIDALITSRQTIYRAPGQTVLRRVRVAPIVNRPHKGVALSVSF